MQNHCPTSHHWNHCKFKNKSEIGSQAKLRHEIETQNVTLAKTMMTLYSSATGSTCLHHRSLMQYVAPHWIQRKKPMLRDRCAPKKSLVYQESTYRPTQVAIRRIHKKVCSEPEPS